MPQILCSTSENVLKVFDQLSDMINGNLHSCVVYYRTYQFRPPIKCLEAGVSRAIRTNFYHISCTVGTQLSGYTVVKMLGSYRS